ncbi:JDVT-CTERM system glutamic-type intramembrane protease [Deferribacter thermophilus]|uniref:JDVT-CTERM system glutamic-type intramembrane protease MrtJ n=1 Tax=Deferribacter thermophilus TaxID=53573 RepID=UPI003C1ACB00
MAYVIILITIFYFFIRFLLTGTLNFHYSVLEILNYLLFSPIIEELFFRGFLQKELKRKNFFSNLIINNKYLFISSANIFVSLLFGLSHLLYSNIIHSVLVIIPSLILGMIYDKYENVLMCILLHAFFNLNIFIG